MIPGLRRNLAARRVLPESLLTFDARPECPTQIVRDTCDPDLDLQPVLIPEETLHGRRPGLARTRWALGLDLLCPTRVPGS